MQGGHPHVAEDRRHGEFGRPSARSVRRAGFQLQNSSPGLVAKMFQQSLVPVERPPKGGSSSNNGLNILQQGVPKLVAVIELKPAPKAATREPP